MISAGPADAAGGLVRAQLDGKRLVLPVFRMQDLVVQLLVFLDEVEASVLDVAEQQPEVARSHNLELSGTEMRNLLHLFQLFWVSVLVWCCFW